SDASRWSFALFEEREDGSGFSNGTLLSDSTSVLAPGESRRIYLRAWPPSDRRTDGAFVNWIGISQRLSTQIYLREFAMGTEATHWTHTTALTWTNNQLVGEPVLLQGRLHWLSWDGQQARLFRTPNPLSVNTTFSNNISFEARISMPVPTNNSVLVGNNWYILSQTGRIVFFSLAQAQGGATVGAVPLGLPSGVEPEPSLPLTRWGALLCFADRQNRLWLFNPANFAFAQLPSASTQPITALSPLSDTMLAVGRADGRVDVYQGDSIAFSNLRLPGASRQAVRFVCLQDGLLTVAAGARIGMYHFGLRKWQWTYTLDSPPITRPVRDAQQGVCYVLTQNGWLYGISHHTGELLPLYPHRLFTEPGVVRAALSLQRRADREAAYLYLQAQLTDGSVRVMLITAENPLNRFVNAQIPANAPVGTRWLFTGNTDQDLALCWIPTGASTDAPRGALYGFRLR
ncbi:MAG: hypothetical protein NZM28_05220, partial [Fimbriimonadales bacterium]|nr:hypothetical protein [Fimbriimonadales bacterium]